MRERGRPSSTAYHEAGHAVACLALDVPVLWASIIPEPGHAGIVRHVPVTDREKLIVIALAGPAAQRVSHPRSDVEGNATGDRDFISVTAETLFAALHDRDSFVRRADRRARDLVRQHWLSVDRIARALQSDKALSGTWLSELHTDAQADWRAVNAWRPELSPLAYAREQAIARQGPPPLRRANIASAAFRLVLAGEDVTETAIVADLVTRGHPARAVRSLWAKVRSSLHRGKS